MRSMIAPTTGTPSTRPSRCSTARILTMIALVASLQLHHPVHALTSSYYTTYAGDATYYGATSGGNCALRDPVPSMYAGMVPIALNGPQYGNADFCGACLQVTGTGQGSGANPVTGTFMAYVSDKCPECAWGSIDMAESGDGRWKVSWQFVPCPVTPSNSMPFYFQGSNSFYLKVQPRDLSSPAVSLSVNGISGTKTEDNFFEVQNGAGFPGTVQITVTTALGASYTASVSGNSGLVYGYSSSGGGNSGSAPNSSSGSSPSPTSGSGTGGSCTADWQRCAGAAGFSYVPYAPCCSPNFSCVSPPDANFWGMQCRQNGS